MLHQISNSIGKDNYNINIYRPTVCWPPHFHRNIELAICLAGQCDLTIDGKSEILQAGDYALILPDQIHAYETPESAQVWIGVFSPDYFGVLSHLLHRRRPEGTIFRPAPADDEQIRALLCCDAPTPMRLCAGLALTADQYLSVVPLLPLIKNDPSERIRAYVEENFRSPLTLRDTAAALGYEYHYFSRRFHRLMGMSFAEYVDLFRHQHALMLLKESDRSITDIAADSGYGSLRAFHLHFSKTQGCTPSEFRQKNFFKKT